MLNINVRRFIRLRTHNIKLYMFPLVDDVCTGETDFCQSLKNAHNTIICHINHLQTFT